MVQMVTFITALVCLAAVLKPCQAFIVGIAVGQTRGEEAGMVLCRDDLRGHDAADLLWVHPQQRVLAAIDRPEATIAMARLLWAAGNRCAVTSLHA